DGLTSGLPVEGERDDGGQIDREDLPPVPPLDRKRRRIGSRTGRPEADREARVARPSAGRWRGRGRKRLRTDDGRRRKHRDGGVAVADDAIDADERAEPQAAREPV